MYSVYLFIFIICCLVSLQQWVATSCYTMYSWQLILSRAWELYVHLLYRLSNTGIIGGFFVDSLKIIAVRDWSFKGILYNHLWILEFHSIYNCKSSLDCCFCENQIEGFGTFVVSWIWYIPVFLWNVKHSLRVPKINTISSTAIDPNYKKCVAICLLRVLLNWEDCAYWSFFTQNLNHRNIVKYQGSFKTKTHLYIILE